MKMCPESFINAVKVYVDNFNRSLEDGSMPKI